MRSLRRRFSCVAAALLGSAAAVCAEPCRLSQVADIEVTVEAESGAILVPVTLGGHEGLMALQLSSGLPYLFDGYIDQLGLRDALKRTGWDASLGGRKVTHEAKVGSTVLGRANFSGWSYFVNPASRDYRPAYLGRPIFGVMTSAFMNVVDLELNLGAGRMRLFRQNDCKVTPVYWDAEVTSVELYVDGSGLMLFPIEVEGQRFEGSLNTNSRLSVMSSEATKRYLGFDETSPGIERDPAFGDDASFRAMSLTAKGLDVRNARVRLRKMPGCTLSAANRSSGAVACSTIMGRTPFSIGTELMKQLRIFVSLRDKKIYFTRDAPAAAPAAANPAVASPGDAGAASGPPAEAARP